MDRNILKFSLILGLMSAVGAFAIDMYLPALPLLAEDLQSTTSAAQMTLMVYFIAFGASNSFTVQPAICLAVKNQSISGWACLW